jgi:hypothetical protein
MTITRCRTPPESAFLEIGRAWYWDGLEAPLRHPGLSMVEIYLALFAHHPRWARSLLIVRGWLVGPFGLRRSTAADFQSMELKPAYAIGERIARFTLLAQNDSEIVTGGDDRHLDFRVSVRRLVDGASSKIVLSTTVSPHNLFGRTYLLVILPFHRLGVRALLSNAVKAGRL